MTSSFAQATAQTTAFTYQGKLTDDCCPATGLYDLTFRVFDNAGPGTTGQQGIAVSKNAVPVTNGLFTVTLDFDFPGDPISFVFTGPRRWLQIDARANNVGQTFVTLLPRTELTPLPYAIYAQTAGRVASGAIATAQLADAAVTAPKIASGQVVTSLNGLQDAVNLLAGANVTLTPNGNNLTINSSGNGAFSLEGNNAYYNAGNVGIGTASPRSRLDVAGNAAVQGDFYLGGDGNVGGLVRAQTFEGDGSRLTGIIGGAGWGLSGNRNTTPGESFIGTTDNKPLEFRVNNARALSIDASNNLIGGSSSNFVALGVRDATLFGGGCLQCIVDPPQIGRAHV